MRVRSSYYLVIFSGSTLRHHSPQYCVHKKIATTVLNLTHSLHSKSIFNAIYHKHNSDHDYGTRILMLIQIKTSMKRQQVLYVHGADLIL